MENKKVKKTNLLYLLCYILVPVVLIFLCAWVGVKYCPTDNSTRSLLLTAPTILSVLWWTFAGRALFRAREKAMEHALDAKGFARSHTFRSRSCIVIADGEKGQIALLFFWNPFEYFVLPASRISKIWVDDGCSGAGFLKGSSRVSFLFVVDGIKIRVNTFTSNKRWRMDSNYILTGISKADMMVDVLKSAGAQAG
ncbi:hypothetical protein [uncultured Pseudoflavonifractor sp.]|uniref:hypothetical protein n=1 Tax=uncultured Pseudoflavonifractor sp. TaxID=1221379 RepID=UPI0025EFBACF|nr:hypothetical protein [uncultured Pseudoflavonifractor sp.]